MKKKSIVFIIILLTFITSFVVFSFLGELRCANFNKALYAFSQNKLSLTLFRAFILTFFAVISVLLVLIYSKNTIKLSRVHERQFRLYEYVFQTISSGIIILDSSGIIRYINPSCYKLLVRNENTSLVGKSYRELVDPVLIPIEEKLLASIVAGESFTREFRVFLKDGIRGILCSVVAGHDNVFGSTFIVSIEDRTKEDEIRQKLSEQLEETHRYAVSKDNFFANMSHEIRTPINAILGMTYFAKKENTNEKTAEYIEKIENASELLLSVVNDILDFSKMQEYKFSLKPERFNLFDLKKVLNDLFSIKAAQKGLDFSIKFDCENPSIVYGDQFRLTQVFMNLINNAIKFTSEGRVSVALTHENIGNDIILRCTVRDTGCGLSEEDIANLFTDYEQFGQVLVKNREGTGLGLAISKRLVELMHGVIWADSYLEKGSAFHFVVVLQRPEQRLYNGSYFELPQIVRTTGRVLIVEDNEINLEIASALLAEAGFVSEHAMDGVEAIELCKLRTPDYYDLILMDIHMPRMNGYDAAKVLRNELDIQCPIFAVTATAEVTQELEANMGVFSGYLFKPYSQSLFKSLFTQNKGLHT